MGHPTLVFRPAHNEFSDNVTPYNCVCPTTCIRQFRTRQPQFRDLTHISQCVNSVPPYVRKLHFMYELIRTSSKYRWSIYRTSGKCRWSIYRTSRKRRGTFGSYIKAEQSSPTVYMIYNIVIKNALKMLYLKWWPKLSILFRPQYVHVQ